VIITMEYIQQGNLNCLINFVWYKVLCHNTLHPGWGHHFVLITLCSFLTFSFFWAFIFHYYQLFISLVASTLSNNAICNLFLTCEKNIRNSWKEDNWVHWYNSAKHMAGSSFFDISCILFAAMITHGMSFFWSLFQ
jgi:hypothetical protein